MKEASKENMDIKYGSVASPGEKTDESNHQNKERKERLPCMLYIVCLIITFHVFSDNLWDVVMNQYAYVAFRKIDFPNMTISNTDKDKSKCDRETNNTMFKMDDKIQEDVSRWSVYMSLASGLPMVISAPLISAMSDKYGRKYFFLIPLFANILKNAMTALGVVFNLNINLFSIFLFVDAVSGSWIATVALGSAYIADVTSSKNRSFAIAILGISVGAGLMLSIFVSGYLISWFGFAVPLVVASACTITAIILVCCCVAESLRERDRADGARPLRQIRAALDFYITKEATGSKGKRWKFIIYITAFTLISLGIFGRKNIEIFYLIGLPFCWNSVQISNFGTVRTIVQDVFGLIMIRVFQCCISDFWIAIIGTISAVGYFIIVGLATNSLHLYMGKCTFVCTPHCK